MRPQDQPRLLTLTVGVVNIILQFFLFFFTVFIYPPKVIGKQKFVWKSEAKMFQFSVLLLLIIDYRCNKVDFRSIIRQVYIGCGSK